MFIKIISNNIKINFLHLANTFNNLIINLFHKWFPYIIEEGRLLKLVTPLVACDFKNKRKYFYSLEEFNKFASNNKISNLTYLKGLGSLSLQDWEFVMNNRVLFKILNDNDSKKYLEIAFGESSDARKKWLAQ